MKKYLFIFLFLSMVCSVNGQTIKYFGQQSSTGTQWTGMNTSYWYANEFTSDKFTCTTTCYLDTIYFYSTAASDFVGLGIVREQDGYIIFSDTIGTGISGNPKWVNVAPTANTIRMDSGYTYTVACWYGGFSTPRGQYTTETNALGYDATASGQTYDRTGYQNFRLSMYAAYHEQGDTWNTAGYGLNGDTYDYAQAIGTAETFMHSNELSRLVYTANTGDSIEYVNVLIDTPNDTLIIGLYNYSTMAMIDTVHLNGLSYQGVIYSVNPNWELTNGVTYSIAVSGFTATSVGAAYDLSSPYNTLYDAAGAMPSTFTDDGGNPSTLWINYGIREGSTGSPTTLRTRRRRVLSQ